MDLIERDRTRTRSRVLGRQPSACQPSTVRTFVRPTVSSFIQTVRPRSFGLNAFSVHSGRAAEQVAPSSFEGRCDFREMRCDGAACPVCRLPCVDCMNSRGTDHHCSSAHPRAHPQTTYKLHRARRRALPTSVRLFVHSMFQLNLRSELGIRGASQPRSESRYAVDTVLISWLPVPVPVVCCLVRWRLGLLLPASSPVSMDARCGSINRHTKTHTCIHTRQREKQ